jgi:hypothetical protein
LLITSLTIVTGRDVAKGISANAMLPISLMMIAGNQKSIGMTNSFQKETSHYMLRFRRVDRSRDYRPARSREQPFIVRAEPAATSRVSVDIVHSQWSNQWIANT